MSDPIPETHGKTGKILFLAVFIGMAVWAGWGLARMGDDRARKKAAMEESLVVGSGTVRPVEETKPKGENSVLFETRKVEVADATRPDRGDFPIDPRVAVPGLPVAAERNVLSDTDPGSAPADAREAPGKLVVTTVAGAEVFEKTAEGERSLGVADKAGRLVADALPAGEYRLVAKHPGCLPQETPVVVSLKAGETVSAEVRPVFRPAALVVLADEGATIRCEGRKFGSGTTMLGNLPANRELTLKLALAGGGERTEAVTLAPRETRVLDLRTKPVAVAETKPAASAASEVPEKGGAVGGGTPGKPVTAARDIAVEIVAVAKSDALVVISRTGDVKAPMKVGDKGVLHLAGGDAQVTCVNLSAGLAICRYEGDVSGTLVLQDVKGRLETPAP